jgi:flagella basal body P-ring formation protein FlgA
MRLSGKLLVIAPFMVVFLSSHGQAVDCDFAVRSVIMADYQLDTASYEIEILSNQLEEEDIDPEELTYSLISQKEPIGLFTILAKVDRGDGRVVKGQVRMRIRKFEEVLVTLDRIQRHEALSRSNLAVRRMEVTTLRERPATSLAELDNHRASRIIRKDQILTHTTAEPVPDIDVGKEVTIVLSEELLQITAPGRCLQSGSAGDYIKVKNQATGKVLKARVIDSQSVAVDI